jgi:hypothetical protein
MNQPVSSDPADDGPGDGLPPPGQGARPSLDRGGYRGEPGDTPAEDTPAAEVDPMPDEYEPL